ncbi:MAG: FadR family transcriptional regulator [Planctomycetes bacterium]|nr:FadR family transcriptional regulator [Planctomycetota bacterium]
MKTKTAAKKRKPPRSTAEHVLDWIQRHMAKYGLKPGDSLPKEMEIARAAGTGRSSVREALTALKSLGIIVSRRKGGIRIVREPVFLEFRRFLVERFTSRERFLNVLEFRAVMEWGLGSLLFANVSARVLREAQAVIDGVRKAGASADLMDAEWEYHTCLTRGAGNELASLLAFIYTPLFDKKSFEKFYNADSDENPEEWMSQHQALLDALKAKNRKAFLALLERHTHSYMRIGTGKAP